MYFGFRKLGLPKTVMVLSLTKLELNKNQLSHISEQIGQLTNLTYLGLSENQLSDIPSTLDKLVTWFSTLKTRPLKSGVGV